MTIAKPPIDGSQGEPPERDVAVTGLESTREPAAPGHDRVGVQGQPPARSRPELPGESHGIREQQAAPERGAAPDPGETVAGLVRELVACLERVDEWAHQLSSRELASATRDVLAVMQVGEATAVRLVTEAVTRSLPAESTAAGTAGWVRHLAEGRPLDELLETEKSGATGPLVDYDKGCEAAEDLAAERTCEQPAAIPVPGIEPYLASRIAKVAEGCTDLKNGIIADAVADRSTSASVAKTALDEIDRTMHAMEDEDVTRDEVLGFFLKLRPGAGARQVNKLVAWLRATYGSEKDLADEGEKLDAAERVKWTDLPNGLVRMQADLSPDHAAIVKQALNALSAPSPGNTCCDDVFHRHSGEPTGERDERPAEKRRCDALMLLLMKAAQLIDADGSIVSSGSARLVVTINFDILTGKLAGLGRTDAGELVSPNLVRQLACDAEILPMVLGSESQPLDVGATKRLVGKELRAAVVHRDKCCTFPGCDRPPAWCQVHHVDPWYHNQQTSLLNSALLCQRHHTVVHQREMTATVTERSVEWDLTPGRMPTGRAA